MICNPSWAGFSIEMDDLLFAVLCVIELGSLVCIFHSVAQHSQPVRPSDECNGLISTVMPEEAFCGFASVSPT